MLRSAPVAKDRRVLVHKRRRRIPPLSKVAITKAIVKTNSKSLVLSVEC